jgi:hypothetical protein
MSKEERENIPTSLIEKLEHDENDPDKSNFHPLYILVYSLYYLLIQLFFVIGMMFE